MTDIEFELHRISRKEMANGWKQVLKTALWRHHNDVMVTFLSFSDNFWNFWPVRSALSSISTFHPHKLSIFLMRYYVDGRRTGRGECNLRRWDKIHSNRALSMITIAGNVNGSTHVMWRNESSIEQRRWALVSISAVRSAVGRLLLGRRWFWFWFSTFWAKNHHFCGCYGVRGP